MTRAVVVALALSLALAGSYAAAGGGTYRPRAPADPCQPRPWRGDGGAVALAEQLALSGVDGAACGLRVSRESLVLALASSAGLASFAADHDLSEGDTAEALRDGLRRALGDASRAGALDPLLAFALRQAVGRLELDGLVRALQGTTLSW